MTKSGSHLVLRSDTLEEDRVIVTPALASKWLGTQVRNRRINDRAIAAYRRDMINGDWEYTGDPIRFDKDGHLIDGQHRLTALSALDPETAIEFLVVRGLPPERQMLMDQGARRSTAQQLELTGYKNSVPLAAGIRMVLIWDNGTLAKPLWDDTALCSTSAILEWAEAHPVEIAVVANNLTRIRHIGLLPAVGTAFCLKTGTNYPDLTTDFFTSLYELENQGKGSPLLTFNRRLQRAKAEHLKLTSVDQLAFLIITWNHWVNNETNHRLIRPAGNEWTNDNFPRLDI